MAVSLFRRWRSQKFRDLVGQESVVSTLQNVLQAGSPARAYLFCGPRGTGKTSSARIFAKAINCERGPAAEPCGECHQCLSIAEGSNLDVFEIDAASHTQVDKIRDFIVEKVHFTPVAAKFKVYIIDEVHKLSTSSFNALLKTLEEPPSHVVFILATTHPHEMPATILSRCQRYDFKPLTAGQTEKHLMMIAKSENLEVDEDAARQLARAADGSLRDALVLFEQSVVFSDGRVTRAKVLDLLGGVGYEVLEEMFTDLNGGNSAGALRRLDDWITRGRDLKRLAESFQEHLRMMLLLKVKSEDQTIRHLSSEERESLERLCAAMTVGAITAWLRQVMELLAAVRHGHAARLEWEMMLVGCAQPEIDPSLQGLERRLERLEAGGVPTPAASAQAAPTATDERLLARIEALEDHQSHDPRLWEKLTRLEAELDAWKDRVNLVSARGTVAPLEEASFALQPEVEAPAPVPPAPVREPEPKLEVKAEVEPKPEPAPKPTPPTVAEAFSSDIVDEWLSMPPVLVNPEDFRRELSLFSSAAAPQRDPEPATPKPPEPQEPEQQQPEPVEERPAEVTLQRPPVAEDVPSPVPQNASEPEDLEPEDEPNYFPEPDYEPELEPEVQAEPPAAVSVSFQESQVSVTVAEPEAPTVEVVAKETTVQVSVTPTAAAPAFAMTPMELGDFWRRLMQGVKEQDVRLYAVLADAKLASVEANTFALSLPAGYDWHFGKIQEGRKLLEQVASRLAGDRPLALECMLGGEKATPPKESEHDDMVARAAGVFGGASIVD